MSSGIRNMKRMVIPMKINGWYYVHSVKRELPIVEELPKEAIFLKTSTGAIPKGIVCEDVRISKRSGARTLYHVHKVGGSNPPYGKYGAHDVYILK